MMKKAGKMFALGAALPFIYMSVALALPALAQTTAQPAATAPSADSSAVKVQPALFEQVVNPGDSFTTSITVSNPDPGPKTLTIGVQDISDIDSSGEPVFSSTSVPEYGLSDWVSVANPTIVVPGYGTYKVPFTINVPKDAAPGGHYGAIFVSFGARRPNFNGSGVGFEIGSLIDLRIAGQANESAQIQSFSTDKGLYQDPRVTFTADVADQGNVLLRPRGPIDIVNMFGQKVATVVMNDQNEAIFPGSSRSFDVSWSGSGFMFGRYDAIMSLSYGDQSQKTVSASTSFWIIPFVPILAVVGSIIFFILIFVWSLRIYIRKKVSAMSGGRGALTEEEKFIYDNRMPFSRFAFVVVASAVFAIVFLLLLFLIFG